MTLKLESYVVADCENNIVSMGSGLECNRLARRMNAGGYWNTPYRVYWVGGDWVSASRG